MTTVWFAANHGSLGGGEVMLLNLARAAAELGYDARVVAPSQPGDVLQLAQADGHRTVAIHGRSRARYATNLAAWDLAERRGVLWANGPVPALATTGHRSRVVHLHQRPSRLQAPVLTAARQGALALVVPSENMAADFPKARVLHNWTQPFAAYAPHLPAGNEVITLGFLGRPSPDKGIEVLADALAELETNQPGRFRLLLAGDPHFVDGPERQRVEEALRPLRTTVDRVGWLGRSDFFSLVDLAVFPAVFPESFGLVVAESMSVGCPFVISDAGALPEVAGAHPYVADAGDPSSLAATIVRAVEAYSLDHLGAAYDRWRGRFSPLAGLAALDALMKDLGVEP